MMTAKVFENGRSQAVRLPKECRFLTDEVMVNKIGDIVMLFPRNNKWDSFMKAIDQMEERKIWYRSVKLYEVYA